MAKIDLIEEITAIAYMHVTDITSDDADLLAISIKKRLEQIRNETLASEANASHESPIKHNSLLANSSLVWDKTKREFKVFGANNMSLGVLSMEVVHRSIDTMVNVLPDGQRIENIDLGHVLDNAVVGMINTGKDAWNTKATEAGMKRHTASDSNG